jgi:hypothetical protein
MPSVTQGLSAPTTLRWALYGVEILGSGGTPPTRVGLTAPTTNWTITASTAVASAAHTVAVGDRIIVLASIESDSLFTGTTSPTISSGTATATWAQTLLYHPGGTGGTQPAGCVYTGTVTGAGTATITCAKPSSSGTLQWGFTSTHWSGTTGIGVTFSGNNGTGAGAPSAAATCSNNSAVQCQINDWNAGATTGFTWLTINGAAETSSFTPVQTSQMTIYGGFRADVGGVAALPPIIVMPPRRP